MRFVVRFAPSAVDQLEALEAYIAIGGTPRTAARFVESIIASCECLSTFPDRGVRRDDLWPGLRITNHRKRVLIAFVVDRDASTVAIVGVFYGGKRVELPGIGG